VPYGEIPGVPVGAQFQNRLELRLAGVHRAPMAGIVGTATSEGAESIVLNGGYEDDLDEGEVIVYTGHGSNDPVTGKQIADQQLTRANAALARNIVTGTPVRVIRGFRNAGPNSPTEGYRYDGLYSVEDYWQETGRSGYRIWRFRLRRVGQPEMANASRVSEPRRSYESQRIETVVQRIVRSSPLGTHVKQLHDWSCQRCGRRMETPAGPYAEAAHIKPLGRPHDGPDSLDNLLCLCPNCHVEFDLGAWTIDESLVIKPDGALLRTVEEHPLSSAFLRHHRDRFSQ
jgi:putative restriction endonuclease